MKIEYRTVTETVEINVEDDWGNIVMELNRKEYNNNQAETRRHDSLEELKDTQKEPSYDESMDELIDKNIKKKDLYDAIAQLEPQQRELLMEVFFKGRKAVDIARKENVSRAAISLRMNRIFVKLRRTLENGD